MNKKEEIWKYSNPLIVKKNAEKYFGNDTPIFLSKQKNKKYMVYNPQTNKMVHWGAMGMEDYTLHKDEKRRLRYLARATNMKGNWKDDKYSPNNLAINLLWS